jgi:hypothetical protein
MKTVNRLRQNKSLILASSLGLCLGTLVYFNFPTPPQVGALGAIDSPFEKAPQAASVIPAGPGEDPATPQAGADEDWVNNGGRFTSETARLVEWVDEGNPVDVQLGDWDSRSYGFGGVNVTSEDFRISTGAETQLPAEYKVYSGRELRGDGTLGEAASIAVVNGALAMAITRDGEQFIVETDPETGELYAIRLHSFDNGHECGSTACGSGHLSCTSDPETRLTQMVAPEGIGEDEPERLPVSMGYGNDGMTVSAADEPSISAAVVDHPHYRHAPQYDASLKDIMILWASAKSQTGDSSGLSARAASYFSMAARVADVYARQLGLRYLMQELILVPSDSSEEDPGNPSTTSITADLDKFRIWLQNYRPQGTYKWGHAALWTNVYGGSGGTVGLAYDDAYGLSFYGHSVQERNWGWEVHAHELGHNCGSLHTSGGVMNPSIQSGNENFFTTVSGTNITAAMDIYNWMKSVSSTYLRGPASLRHPEEIPFGVDDSFETATNTPVLMDVLANDLRQVPNGATNTLRLVELSQVYPRSAGSVRIDNGQVEFIPATGFTGRVWFTYTLGGDVGNLGNGWLHSADVVVTVGGDSSNPTQSPATSLADDFISSDLSGAVRFNPLLNDEGSGRLWSGDVHAVVGPNDNTAESYSDRAFRLVNATVVSGTGTLSLEKSAMSRNGSAGTDNTGYMTYTPGSGDAGQVVIEYTVMDASGATSTARVYLASTPEVLVTASTDEILEDSGTPVAFSFIRAGDLSGDETIGFRVSGTADPSGLRADYALAGHTSFDPVAKTGTVVIPAGETATLVYAAFLGDGVSEGTETLSVTITSTSALPISTSRGSATLTVNEATAMGLLEESFSSFTSDPATWGGWSNLKNNNPSGKGGQDDFDWTVASGSTSTSGTGPSGDHTSGSGKYMLAEATGNTGQYAIFESPVVSVSGRSSAQLSFWYHMYGSAMGSLTVDLYVNGSLAQAGLWSRSGQQSSSGSDWKEVVISLDSWLPASQIQLRFRADIGSGETSDIAIDDVTLTTAFSASAMAPVVLVDPTGCSAESGENVYLSVIPEGFPAPQIQWLKNGAPISGATGPSYFISSIDESGVGSYQAAISNEIGAAYSLPADVDIGTPPPDPVGQAYMNWTVIENLPFDKVAHGLDPDGDGIPNLLEFAYGLPAMVADTTAIPACSVVFDSGQQYLYFTYRRRVGGEGATGVNYTVDDITYTVETSSTLSGTWDSGPGLFEVVSVEPYGAGHQVVTLRMSIGGGPAFMRLSVSSAAPL